MEKTNKRVLITGGNKGIGLEVTKYFYEKNYDIVVLARNSNECELKDPSRIELIDFDLTEIERIPALIADIGHLDVLINNAGIMNTVPYFDYSKDKIDTIIKINLEAPVSLMTEVSKSMMKKGAGRIVNNASIAGQIGHPDIWYGITKAGLINATKSFAKILGKDGIIVNAVAPSPVETQMLNSIPEQRQKEFLKSVILGRFATASEIAKTIGWLGTESPEYMNGICLDLNNGSFLR